MNSKKCKKFVSCLTLLTAIFLGTSAHATLIGNTIQVTGSGLNPSSATIGDGIEFTGLGEYLNFDFGANTLTITTTVNWQGWNVGWGSWGNYVFSGFSERITSLSIASNTGYVGDYGSSFSGTLLEGFSFTDDSITLNMDSGHAWYDSKLVYNINANPVPEPSTLVLLGAGLAGAAIFRRKMQR